MKSPKVCVIIVTYNGIRWIEKCLISVGKSKISADVLVVDNGSTDGTVMVLKQNPQVSFLHVSDKNLGFGKANNLGIQKGYELGYDYFFLLNQDTRIESDVIGELIDCLKANTDYGVISPMHYDGSGENLDFFFEAYLSRTPGYQEDLQCNNDIKRIYTTPFVNAASWMIGKSTLERVGLFHPLFEHYGEDDNYIDRLHTKGLKVGIATRVKIYHDRDTDKINPLKDDPKRLFQRMLLQKLLDPRDVHSFSKAYQVSRKLSKELSRKVPLLKRPSYRLHCISVFIDVYNKVKAFEKQRQSELNII